MARPLSKLAPDWWDYTTLDPAILADAARLTVKDVEQLGRPGFTVVLYDTLEEFYLAEALEYVEAWRQASAARPAGICGPIGPTEQLPLVSRIVNALELDLRHAHFWGMDEWVENGRPVPASHPLSFARADRELCFDRIERSLRMPEANLHFPTGDLSAYSRGFEEVRCVVMQGGQGDTKHWAFNDPPRAHGRVSGRAANAGGVPGARRPRGGPPPHHHHAERAHLGRRPGQPRADAGRHRGSARNLARAEGLDLAGGRARQCLRAAADRVHDLQATRGRGGPHVPPRRSSRRSVQLSALRTGHRRGGNALRRRGVGEAAPRRYSE